MKQTNKPSIFQSFSLILLSHLIMDFMLAVWPVFKILTELDVAKAGLIAGIGMFIGESSQLFFGVLSDRGHHKKLISLGLLLTSAVAFYGYFDNYLLLFILVLCCYLGAGAFHPAAAGMVGSWSSSSKGVYLALFATGGSAGSAISQMVFSGTYTLMNGHTFIFLLPSICLAVWIYFYSFPPHKPSEKKINLQRLLKWIKPQKKELMHLYFIQVSMQAILVSFIFLLPDVLSLRGYESWFCLGGAHFCFVMGAVSMSVPAGYFVDRYSHRRVLLVAILTGVMTFYLFLLAGEISVWATILLLFVMGGCMGIITPVVLAAGNTLVPIHAGSFISASLMGGAAALGSFGLIASGMMATLFIESAPVKALQVMGALFIFIIYFIFQLSMEEEKREEPVSRVAA